MIHTDPETDLLQCSTRGYITLKCCNLRGKREGGREGERERGREGREGEKGERERRERGREGREGREGEKGEREGEREGGRETEREREVKLKILKILPNTIKQTHTSADHKSHYK